MTDELHNRLHIHQLIRPDLFCSNQENSHICENEQTVGPVRQNQSSIDINEPLFFFTNKGPLSVDGYEYHVSKRSDSRYSSYLYMLFTEQDVDINLLDEYLDEAQQSQADKQLQAEQDLINQIFSDLTRGGGGSGMNFGGGLSKLGSVNDTGHTTIDKFRVLVSVGSNINRIVDTSSQGFTVEFTDGDICNKETG